jgi:hypothetical protein
LVPVKYVYGDTDRDGNDRGSSCTVADFSKRLDERSLDDRLPCAYCHKMFNTATHVRTHIEDLHFPSETPCTICQKVFLSKPKMLRHKSKKHSSR